MCARVKRAVRSEQTCGQFDQTIEWMTQFMVLLNHRALLIAACLRRVCKEWGSCVGGGNISHESEILWSFQASIYRVYEVNCSLNNRFFLGSVQNILNLKTVLIRFFIAIFKDH